MTNRQEARVRLRARKVNNPSTCHSTSIDSTTWQNMDSSLLLDVVSQCGPRRGVLTQYKPTCPRLSQYNVLPISLRTQAVFNCGPRLAVANCHATPPLHYIYHPQSLTAIRNFLASSLCLLVFLFDSGIILIILSASSYLSKSRKQTTIQPRKSI